MKLFAWLFLIVCFVFVVIYTYDYINLPKLDKIGTINNCITASEKDQFGLFKQDTYQIYLPKDWPFMELNTGKIPGTYNFGINKDDSYEFLSIWSNDYNKTSDDLLLETLKPLTNYTVDEQSTLKTNNGEQLKRIIISFKGENNTYKQELYTYTKDNKGYLILARLSSQNINEFQTTLDKIICSFKVN